MSKLLRIGIALTFGLAAIGAANLNQASADEGMWTFDNFPSQRMRAAYGWAPDQAWLDRVMAGSARIEGVCSASNVSGEGLVLTNHHCVLDCAQDFSEAGRDVVRMGFLTQSRAEERQCPGMAVQVLTGITDVTPRINAATTTAAPDQFTHLRDAEIARLEQACQGSAADRRCEVVTLYQGGRYALYNYKRYDDVRLVFAPELDAAFFGGDPDNFNFPRYAFDVAFLRLYENGAPAHTPNHLSLRTTALTDNEPVFTAGNPGRTSRLLSSAELAFQRDYFLPWRLSTLSEWRGRLATYMAESPEHARVASDTFFSVENSYKALWGRRMALADAASFAQIQTRERDLQARVARNRASQREVGDAWSEIARAQQTYRGFYLTHQYLEARAGGGSELFAIARDLVRAAAERDKPDAERLPNYTQSRLASIEQSVMADRPIDRSFEAMKMAFWLSKTREYLTGDDPVVRQMLGRESPDGLAQRLTTNTRLADPAERRRLWQGGARAIAASNDPLIVWVRSWDQAARQVRERHVREVEGPIARAQERIARARFRAFGETAYPDATFSPRLSYGRVAGWTEPGGRAVPSFTRLGGLYERATGSEPFALTPHWLAARGRLDASLIYNVSTSNDIIGGNSGSPLLDREGRVVGVAFDGNIHSLGGEYLYDPALNRTVSVAAAAIPPVLTEVYGLRALTAELRGQ
jgi:V8-like Glu-specific endopeptidase